MTATKREHFGRRFRHSWNGDAEWQCQIQVAETLFKSPVCETAGEARYNLLHQLGAVLFTVPDPDEDAAILKRRVNGAISI